MNLTKPLALTMFIVLVISIIVTSILVHNQNPPYPDEFYIGISYGQDTAEEAKILIDKVKDYTNLFIINSYPITTNNTTPQVLNEICDYCAEAKLRFIVYFFSFLSGPWQQEWLDTAEQRWGEMFLGVYLRDEPGGRQIELAEVVENASSYSDAAAKFVQQISTTFSVNFLNKKGVPIFTSDFALYYFDYLAGYSDVFAELGWNNSRTREIALCRGAADMLKKEWGTIITWTFNQPPYIANNETIYQDMLSSYDAGAKYIIIFNYPKYPEDNKYGILTDAHFSAMRRFWDYAAINQRHREKAEVAYILPEYYGWGMRHPEDKIWGIWSADEKSPIIWENVNKLEAKYGLRLDIIYNDPNYNSIEKYRRVYFWNDTVN